VAAKLNVKPEQVLICSTGVIGVPHPDRHPAGGARPTGWRPCGPRGRPAPPAHILTTIWPSKQIALEADLGGQRVAFIGGMAKGLGKIHPGTIGHPAGLCQLRCRGSGRIWAGHVGRAVARSFNAITVDGDTSTTTDCYLPLQRPALNPGSIPPWAADSGMSQHLARAVACDGEGGHLA